MNTGGMNIGGTDLLRALGGGGESIRARPASAERGSSGSSVGGVAGVSFADLLAKARSGEVHSGLEVTVARGAGLELSEDQLQRLSAAADLAEAAGATRALVKIDGMSLVIDVGVRQVSPAPAVKPGQVMTGIDAVIELPSFGGVQDARMTGVSRASASSGLERLAGGVGAWRREK